jgi:CPA1 family monovalent cation:H+ antiporter
VTVESTSIILFSIATAVAIAVRRFRVPYTVALVIVGLVLGAFRVIEVPSLTKELLFTAFLPGLLFEAAFDIDAREFWSNRVAISSLALPGVVVAIALTGVMTTAVLRALALERTFTIEYGLVFGALVAATDPIAVVGLFRTLNAPSRLSILIDGESLLNDGTAIVLLTLPLTFVSGATTSFGSLVIDFVTIVGGGVLVGALVGFAASRVTSHVDDAMIEIAITTIAAYGAFVIGAQFHSSGVIATVVAGMVCGNYGRQIGMSASTRVAVDTFGTTSPSLSTRSSSCSLGSRSTLGRSWHRGSRSSLRISPFSRRAPASSASSQYSSGAALSGFRCHGARFSSGVACAARCRWSSRSASSPTFPIATSSSR